MRLLRSKKSGWTTKKRFRKPDAGSGKRSCHLAVGVTRWISSKTSVAVNQKSTRYCDIRVLLSQILRCVSRLG